MPFKAFKRQGRIFKSTTEWRAEAEDEGILVQFEAQKGHVAIFVTHTWWDRNYTDKTNDPSDMYDMGAPDYQTGEKKDLKWRVIVAGVERLIEEKGLGAENVVLWVVCCCSLKPSQPLFCQLTHILIPPQHRTGFPFTKATRKRS